MSDVAAWKDLVCRLPGVLGVEFHVEDQRVTELHVLSDQSRTPKQFARDIQSALLAGFQLELDHRVISVAQISGEMREKHTRLIFDRLSLASSRDGITVDVFLRLGDRSCSGHSHCDSSPGARTRAIAEASVSAINQFLPDRCRFTLDDVRLSTLGERDVAMVGVALKADGKNEALLGACYVGEEPNYSVVLATLDAVNRRLPVLPTQASLH